MGAFARPAAAAPSPLDAVHRPLARLQRDFTRTETRFDRDAEYRRTRVRYSRLLASPEWHEYRRGLARLDPAAVRSAGPAGSKAFWINTYNAVALEAAELPGNATTAERGMPVESSRFFTTGHAVAGEVVTLDRVEEMLAGFDDPRVWFALHLPAVDSPPLPEAPLTAGDVDDGLDRAVAGFLADPEMFRIDRAANRVVMSDVFRRFGDRLAEDLPGGGDGAWREAVASYPPAERGFIRFLLSRVRPADREFILLKRPRVRYDPFDTTIDAIP